MNTMRTLTLSGLTARYGLAEALFGVDLDVTQGETVGLLGRNGAGKTTLLKSVVGDPELTLGGTVTVDGEVISGRPTYRIARSGVSWVPDDRRIFTALSVRENLELARSRHAPPDQLDHVLAVVPLVEDLLSRRGFELSGGEQQAVTIARALMSAPQFLLLDEPTEGLAPLVVHQLREAITRLPKEFDVGVLLAEQNLGFVTALARRVVILVGGRVAWSGTTAALDTDPDLVDRHLSAGAGTP